MYSKSHLLFPTLVWSRNQVQRVNSQPVFQQTPLKCGTKVDNFLEWAKFWLKDESGVMEVFYGHECTNNFLSPSNAIDFHGWCYFLSVYRKGAKIFLRHDAFKAQGFYRRYSFGTYFFATNARMVFIFPQIPRIFTDDCKYFFYKGWWICAICKISVRIMMSIFK